MQEKRLRESKNLIRSGFAGSYLWQRKFMRATAENRVCMLMAANQVGKTKTGCLIDAMQLTGIYPDGYEGYRFAYPITAWVLGYSGEKIRDLLQAPLVGAYSNGTLMGGLIHRDLIDDCIPMLGTARGVREVKIKHISGGISRLQFWSYSQGQHALMGDKVDWFHIDEEPRDGQIYPQVLTRTANGARGKGGRGMLTFTPENGRTELVMNFTDRDAPGQYLQTATWDDAPHLTDETKEMLLAMFPAWQRDMRTRGVPLHGAGLVFDLDVNVCKVKPFECPDHFLVINAMDFGWDHPQAHVQLWFDTDEDIIYVARAVKMQRSEPYVVWNKIKSWAEYVPTSWPQDGLQKEKGTGKTQKSYYSEAGWDMLPNHATWGEGGNSVNTGIMLIYNAIKAGKFKVFDHLEDVFDEFLHYNKDESGKIVAIRDDLLSAIRYAIMMKRFAIRMIDVGESDDYDYTEQKPVGGWA